MSKACSVAMDLQLVFHGMQHMQRADAMERAGLTVSMACSPAMHVGVTKACTLVPANSQLQCPWHAVQLCEHGMYVH